MFELENAGELTGRLVLIVCQAGLKNWLHL